jgi:hypothetical protein
MMDEMDTEAEGEGEEGEGEKGAVGVEGESEGREVELLLESMGWDVGGVGAEGCQAHLDADELSVVAQDVEELATRLGLDELLGYKATFAVVSCLRIYVQ